MVGVAAGAMPALVAAIETASQQRQQQERDNSSKQHWEQ